MRCTCSRRKASPSASASTEAGYSGKASSPVRPSKVYTYSMCSGNEHKVLPHTELVPANSPVQLMCRSSAWHYLFLLNSHCGMWFSRVTNHSPFLTVLATDVYWPFFVVVVVVPFFYVSWHAFGRFGRLAVANVNLYIDELKISEITCVDNRQRRNA